MTIKYCAYTHIPIFLFLNCPKCQTRFWYVDKRIEQTKTKEKKYKKEKKKKEEKKTKTL